MAATHHYGTYWAICQRSTGALLPLRSDNRHSHAEFTDYGPPRLFKTKGGAATALRHWRKGPWVSTREWDSINEYGDGFYVQGLPAPKGNAPTDRQGSEYAVVPVTLFHMDMARAR